TTAVFLGLASALFAFAAGLAIFHAAIAGVIAAVIAGGVVGWATRTQRLFTFDESAPRLFTTTSAVLSVIALVLLVRTTVFMVDPTRIAYSTFPSSNWEAQHSCLSAYHIAAEAVGSANVYDNAL